MATKTKAAPKPAAKKAAPKRKAAKPPEPTRVESADVSLGDAHVVLALDGKDFRLEPVVVEQLRRDFERAHLALN